MKSTHVNGVELEFQVSGTGTPLLFISSVLADGFTPLLSEPALADHHQLISYHRRGWVASTPTPTPVSVADHAADAAALLRYLGGYRGSTWPATPPARWSPPSSHWTNRRS